MRLTKFVKDKSCEIEEIQTEKVELWF